MDYPESYFAGEKICDFYVPPMMKRVWASLLDMLAVIDCVCKVYGIPYYAADGTLLGAVRHKGFIPWDDDIDLYMFRDDLFRFAEIALDVLPEFGLELISPYNESDYNNPLFGVFNGKTMELSEERLQKYHGCPFSIRIDIFAIDNLPDDEGIIQEKLRLSAEAWNLAEVWNDPNKAEKDKNDRLQSILRRSGFELLKDIPIKQQLSMLCDMVVISDDCSESKKVACLHQYSNTYGPCFMREWFGKPDYLKFEHLNVPVPKDYNSILKTIYGDYMKPVRGGGTHSYPFYAEQMKMLHEAFNKKGVAIPKIFQE